VGGTFRFAMTRPSGLDAAFSEDAYQWQLVEEIFDGLVGLDPDLNVVPALARTWTVSPDGLTYTFGLWPEARFHNGRAVTAGDVVYSFLRAARVRGGLAGEYVSHIRGMPEAVSGRADSVAGMEVVDPSTLVIRLARPYTPFLATLAIPQLGIVPREEAEGRGARFARQPVGSGPFRVLEWRADDVLVLVANEAYHLGRPFMDRVEVQFADWWSNALDRFLSGEVDMALLGREDRARLPKDVPVVQRLELGMLCLGLNTAFPPLGDARVRQAIALSLDREAMVEASGRVALPSRGVVPDGIPGGGPRGFAPERDVAAARRVLAQAGHAEGRGLPRIDLWANRNSDWVRRTAEVVARNLGEIGVAVRERTAAWSEFLDQMNTRRTPAYMITWVADAPDRDAYLGVLFHSRGANNYLGYSDPEVDQLLEAARSALDPLERMRLYGRAEQRIGEANVLLPLLSQANVLATRPGLRGFTLNSFGITDLRRLWWAEPR
jgi:peptide/nickel transport system substrate-binding protein/oligopeptide transport system substrate-binding protein